MSRQAIELLRATGLLQPNDDVADLAAIPDTELLKTLEYYYRTRVESADSEIASLAETNLEDSALISTVSAANAVFALSPKLLVQESLVADDPVFDFVTPEHEMTTVEKQALGMRSNARLDRPRLHNQLSYFAALAPLIDAGLLHVLPLSLLHAAPEKVPFNFPKNLYREQVPPNAVESIKSSAIVRPMERTSEGLIILDEPNVQRKRQVCVTFEGDEAATGCSFYHFREFEFHGATSKGLVRFSYKPWSDEPLDQAQYDIWIEQIINQTVGARLKAIAREMRLADYVGAPYTTESTFEADLLALAGGIKGEETAAVNFLQANADLLELTDPKLILDVRTRNPALFARFRLSIAATTEQLKGVGEVEFERRAKQIFESEIQPQIAEINAALGKIEGATAKGSLSGVAALVLALLSGSGLPAAAWLSLTAAGAGIEALPAVGDYMRSRKQPQFLWHKLAKRQ